LLVDHDHQVKSEDVISILSFMDEARQREVYLRIARAAAIAGKSELASMAAARAQALAGNTDNAFGALADFYGGMAAIPTDRINAAARNIDTISDSDLSPRDKALRAAAKSVAEQVLRAPDPASLTQGSPPKSSDQEMTSEQEDVPQVAEQGGEHDAAPGPAAADAASLPISGASGKKDADPSFSSFVTSSRSQLDEIDGLLNKESN
jgi:chemotaxis protein MotC